MHLVFLFACSPAPSDVASLTLPSDAPLPLNAAVEDRVDDVLSQLTLEEKAAMMAGTSLIPSGAGWPTTGVPRLEIPGFRMTDGPRGVGLAAVATVFPVGVARAATWDEALEEEIGRAMGAEARAGGKDVLLAPTLNLTRHPRWGRAQESYGEEPIVLGRMAAAFIRGAEDHVFATAKHFAANSIERTRYDVDVQMDERTLREVYTPHFRVAVREGGAGMVMASYNQVNGDYATENRHLLTDLLKQEWGFQGVVMSDWIWGMTDGALALGAGLDVEMPIADQMRGIGERVAAGEVPLDRLDDAVRRQLRLTFLDEARGDVAPEVIRSEAHHEIARRAAAESMVLLKNDGALPLAAGARVAVVGALADLANTGDRGSSNVPYADVVTPLAGLSERYDVDAIPSDTPDAAQLDAIAAAEAAIVVVGLTWEQEGEGIFEFSSADREDLALSPAHLALIQQVAARQPRTIVVLEGSGPLLVEGIVDDIPALVMAWYPGQEGGRALADVLTGDLDFTGHLPMVWPRSEDQLPPFDDVSLTVEYGMLHGWRWMERQGLDPRFPFGFGLSYNAPRVASAVLQGAPWPEDELRVEGALTAAGHQLVRVYAGPDDPAVERPDRVLVGYARLDGDDRFSIPIDRRWLSTWDEALSAYVLQSGAWTVEVEDSEGVAATLALDLGG